MLRLATFRKIGWFRILSVAERTLKQGIMKTPGSSGLYILSFEVLTIFARAVHSYTSGFYATHALRGYSSRNTTHTVLPKLTAWPYIITAQQNTVDCSKDALAISVVQKVVLSFNGYWGKRSE